MSRPGFHTDYYHNQGTTDNSWGLKNSVTLSNGKRYARVEQSLAYLDPVTGAHYIGSQFAQYTPGIVISPDGSYYGNGSGYTPFNSNNDTYNTGSVGMTGGDSDVLQLSDAKQRNIPLPFVENCRVTVLTHHAHRLEHVDQFQRVPERLGVLPHLRHIRDGDQQRGVKPRRQEP